jgi:hypothetical protein
MKQSKNPSKTLSAAPIATTPLIPTMLPAKLRRVRVLLFCVQAMHRVCNFATRATLHLENFGDHHNALISDAVAGDIEKGERAIQLDSSFTQT